MTKNYSTSILICLFLCLNLSFTQAQETQDTTSQKQINNFPSKSPTVKNEGKFRANAIKDYNNAYYVLDRVNESIGLPPNQINFQTPQSTLEHFIIKSRNEDYEEAAYALNLNLFPDNITKKDAATLAEKLYFVINQRVNINWDELPDRADGQIDIQTNTNQAVAGQPRRSIVFGEVDLDGKGIVFRVQRVKYKDYGSFWLISPNTVENIDAMYATYGPRKLDRMMPDWARIRIFNMPVWKFVGALVLLFICYYIGKFVAYFLKKILLKSNKKWLKNIANKLAKPAGFAIGVLAFYLLLNHLISFTGKFASAIYAILLILVIGTITWFIMRMIDYFMLYVAENKIGDTSVEENTEARRMLTYVSVARRIITFLVIIIGASVVLSQFRSLEKLGISLLASAGVATVILGIAAQSTLGNIVAGIQIAITKPARIGDTIIIDDDWGYVEDIKFTYMVVRTWDWRRLVVPLKYIISNTFENWSMTSAHQIRPIILYADYKIDVKKVRKKFEELLEASDDWDEDHPPIVQVVDTTEKAIKIRCLCSSKDASSTWDLHCELREELVRFISTLENGENLSTSRVRVQEFPSVKEKSNPQKDKD
ncbi:mechanosensitive ion channel family protein [Mesonia aestuariivivens]|uniref:Mechanosensitive ion channel family protein n=1 Tax=Mesonia aestuariivivens TaxID=2796128 RepID=A0ABS6W1N3_9FLAO|nr:mechanosensitive ion channel family protein [Mesonia aestuariivivens]MBW2961436.1 mechanosensitive ion channel family protein [Mesonia aestuariivivens]